MKSVIRTRITSLFVAAACAILLTLCQDVVRADGLPVSGSTFGCFADLGCVPGENEITLQGLTFTGASFDFSNAFGQTVNFGTLSLNRDPVDYNGAEFLIFYLFEEPPFAVFPDFGLDGAELSGIVNDQGFGGVLLNFIIGFEDFDFEGRLFRVTVNNVFVPAGGTVNLTASVAPIPEPATMLLLGTGLAGIGRMIRKRRQAQ